jgi:hypothetical protein
MIRDRFILTVEPTPADVLAVIRLRRAFQSSPE